MIVQDELSHNYFCPIISHQPFPKLAECLGSKCMAWRPYQNGLGFCGLCNPARDYGTPDEQSIKHSAARAGVVELSEHRP